MLFLLRAHARKVVTPHILVSYSCFVGLERVKLGGDSTISLLLSYALPSPSSLVLIVTLVRILLLDLVVSLFLVVTPTNHPCHHPLFFPRPYAFLLSLRFSLSVS